MTTAATQANVLLVDDDTHITTALAKTAISRGNMGSMGQLTAEAYGILERVSMDVVISDERMPGESGSQFLSQVRRRYPKTIRIILSGQASLEAAIRAINEGEVYRFFLKPCNPTDLIVTIRRALEHQRLAQQSRALLWEFRRQSALLDAAQTGQTELLDVQRDASGAVLVDEAEASESVDSLLREIELSMTRERARFAR